ncbi:transmembrane protein 107 isoform X3 [Monodelphis domestica]|uniref:Transmembrane protein 107 n=1 Tax=Monodelphis domestica TaxID=13616 RepID=A0A5F8HAB0_MONDO|nr:transmembrane protein 107 isoform X3 [Monodelphis domestica]
MGRVNGLVPCRFLTLLAHLVIVITIFWTRASNVQASLPPNFSKEEYDEEDYCVLPAFTEVVMMISVFALKRKSF